jgi:hypothetical protein
VKCKCHRNASANSFSNNFFKITGRLDWERKNDFPAGTALIVAWQGRVITIFTENIYYIAVNTTPFPTGGVSCLG